MGQDEFSCYNKLIFGIDSECDFHVYSLKGYMQDIKQSITKYRRDGALYYEVKSDHLIALLEKDLLTQKEL